MSEAKLSPVETIKEQSNYLRGTIAAGTAGRQRRFQQGQHQLLKHHGTYQQDNRDARAAARKAGRQRQSLQHDGPHQDARRQADQRAAAGRIGSVRRVGQRHAAHHQPPGAAIARRSSRATCEQTIQRINEVQLTTLAACGDVERNVMCCPAPYQATRCTRKCRRWPTRWRSTSAPRTRAYHELWLQDPDTGERATWPADGPTDEVEPIYGPTLSAAQVQDGGRLRRATIASTCTPTTWDSWRWSARAESSATTCWSAAAWA